MPVFVLHLLKTGYGAQRFRIQVSFTCISVRLFGRDALFAGFLLRELIQIVVVKPLEADCAGLRVTELDVGCDPSRGSSG